MSRIFVIMGKSSSGKDTVFSELCKNKELGLKTVVMYTTRPMRKGETEGKEYFFTDESRVKEFEKNGKIIELREYSTVYGIWKYFTADDGQIDMSGNENYLIIGTLEAYEKFAGYYGKDKVYPIYIEIDDGIRIRRALEREERQEIPKYAEMCRRYLADGEDFSEDKLIEAGITKRYRNIILEDCVKEITGDITKLQN